MSKFMNLELVQRHEEIITEHAYKDAISRAIPDSHVTFSLSSRFDR